MGGQGSTVRLQRVLGRWDLLALSIGQIIGGGIWAPSKYHVSNGTPWAFALLAGAVSLLQLVLLLGNMNWSGSLGACAAVAGGLVFVALRSRRAAVDTSYEPA